MGSPVYKIVLGMSYYIHSGGPVWVHWLMARGQILKDSLFLLCTP